jgi:hypothetical protein
MSSLFQIVYSSTATRDLSGAELLELLKRSVARNRLAGVTGLLLYNGGRFMQVLEGEEADVIRLFAKISHDPCHRHVVPLLHGSIGQRCFSDSTMAFPDLDSPELRNLPGYSEFLNTPLDGEFLAKDVPECQKLLLHFKRNIHENLQGENGLCPQGCLATRLCTLSVTHLLSEFASQRQNFETLLASP